MTAADPGPPPAHVFLFRGHPVDHPRRQAPRFPLDQVETATTAIEGLLGRLDARANDLAVCGGWCGGDLLFAKAALDRGLTVELHLALSSDDFLRHAVAFAGQQWVDLFHLVGAHRRTRLLEPTPATAGAPTDAFADVGRRMADRALTWGSSRVRLICLWDGTGGDLPGGIADTVQRIGDAGGEVHHLDTTTLW